MNVTMLHLFISYFYLFVFLYRYGSLTWEWQPRIALRNPIHPLLISLVYKMIAILGVDSQWMIMKSPQILHGCFAAIADLHLYKLTYQLSGFEIAKWTLFHQVCNWFTIYCATRSLSNCIEWCLCIIGLYYYPWDAVCQTKQIIQFPISSNYDQSKWFIFIAVVCVLIRPTAFIIWFPLCLWHIWKNCIVNSLSVNNHRSLKEYQVYSRAKRFVGHFVYQIGIYLSIIVPCVVFSCILDRWTFNQWTVDQWNFIKFNFLFGGSGVYGVQPWHWYLSQGFTAMLLTQTPLVIIFIVMYFIFGPRLMRNLIIRKKTDYSKNSSNHLLSDPCGLCIVVIGWTVFWYR
ncbi:GPI mannosyltransferase 3 [Schistosoma japonicum]|nr:GPI mannosyltransferase 3 [Schistosoma japonicum]